MSLIVATSRIDENNLPQPTERSANFKNFFRSPIEIEADSEIAVQSVKIQRTGNITVEEEDFFCHYFGADPLSLLPYIGQNNPSLSRTIKVPKGTYSISGYEKEVQDALNAQYDDPRTFGGYGVDIHTNASGVELGVDIQCVDKGTAFGSDFHASLSSVPSFSISNPYSFNTDRVIEASSAFTWTPGTGTFLSTYDTTLLAESKSVGMLTGFPFGLNNGGFVVETKNASDEPFVVGLSRPQIQIESYKNSQAATIDERRKGILNLDRLTLGNGPTAYPVINSYDGERNLGGTYETYDYAFILDEDDNITIAQRVWSSGQKTAGGTSSFPPPFGGLDISYMQEIPYWLNAYTQRPAGDPTKLTKAQFGASWDGIRFLGVGDEVELHFKQTGKQVFDKIVSSSFDSGAVGSCFNPIGTTSYALYPQINIGKGSMKITKFESSNTLNQYKFPVFTTGITGGYVPGDDAFSNEGFFYLLHSGGDTDDEPQFHLPSTRTLCSNTLQELIVNCDGSRPKLPITNIYSLSNYYFELLNAAGGVDFKHLFTLSKFKVRTRFDTTIASQHFPNMAGRLGFDDRAFIISNNADGYVSGDNSLTITFTSTGALEKTSMSSFIRIPNLTHKTFNGAQSGLSKIIYQLPQFSNDGRQFGPLYFEANEKTYVKLHNPSPLILNMLEVQIVDSQERETTGLVGDTQIVFHVRKHK